MNSKLDRNEAMDRLFHPGGEPSRSGIFGDVRNADMAGSDIPADMAMF